MCGLVGFYPKKNKQADISKLLPMWVINEARGTDSCGITIGDTRLIGTGVKESKVRDYLTTGTNLNTILNLNIKNKPIICHTRASTNGSHNDYNAHPFTWTRKNTKNSYFCFAHNGVIRDLSALKTKLGMDRHDKDLLVIDSHVLGLAMYDSFVGLLDEETILKSYEGNAAFICYDNKTFKVWKGANHGTEERPLYFVETEDGWYFHSINLALEIMFPKSVISEVENNSLMTFKNNALDNTKLIERKVTAVIVPVTNTHANSKWYGYPYVGDDYYDGVDDDGINYDPRSIRSYKEKTPGFINKLLKFNLNQLLLSSEKENFNITLENDGENALQYITDDGIVVDGTYSFIPDAKSGLPTNVLSVIPQKGVQLSFNNGIIVKHEFTYKSFLTLLKSKLEQKHSYNYICTMYNKLIESFIVDVIPLKDEDGCIECVLFRNLDNKLDFITKDENKEVYVTTSFGDYKKLTSINNDIKIIDI